MGPLGRRLVAYRELLVTLVGVVLGVTALLLVGRDGWVGWQPSAAMLRGHFFCEALHEGAVKQPMNTWSNLGFISVGLGVAYHLGRTAGEEPLRANRMTETRFYPAFYAALVAFLGVGSMWLHASWTYWGGFVDVASMLVYASFLLPYNLTRRFDLSRGAFTLLYAVLAGGSVALYYWKPAPLRVELLGTVWNVRIFAVLLAIWVAAEVPLARRPRAEPRWLLAGAGCFFAGFAAWLPSDNGGCLCDPKSPFQGHALWHLLCAAATGCLYRYYRSEARLSSTS